MKRGILAPVLLLALAGCRPAEEAALPVQTSAVTESLVVKAGGTGPSDTQPFEVRGNRLRVKYKLAQAGQVSFTVNRVVSDTQISMVAQRIESNSGLSGLTDIPLAPGRYRLSVDAGGPWTAQLFDVR